jgi:hypothetical protein
MADFPQSQILPLFLSNFSAYGAGSEAQRLSGASGFGAISPVNERGYFVPVYLPFSYPVHRVFWANGSTATGEMCFAIYTLDGARIYTTGKVVMGGATQLQFVSPTPFILAPGGYYFGQSFKGTVASRMWGASGLTEPGGRGAGMLQQETAFELPVTATFAAWASATVLPLNGVTRTASGF